MPAAFSSLPHLGIASLDRHASGSSSVRTPCQGFLHAAEALQPTGWGRVAPEKADKAAGRYFVRLSGVYKGTHPAFVVN